MAKTKDRSKLKYVRVDLDAATHARLKEYADREDKTVSKIVRRLLIEYLDKAA